MTSLSYRGAGGPGIVQMVGMVASDKATGGPRLLTVRTMGPRSTDLRCFFGGLGVRQNVNGRAKPRACGRWDREADGPRLGQAGPLARASARANDREI